MTDQSNSEEDLAADFRALGNNLLGVLQAAWDRPERQKLQQEIENGLLELGATLKQASDDFSETPVGNRIKTGVDEIRARVESGQVEEVIRNDLQSALRTINTELENLTSKMGAATKKSPDHGDEGE